MAAAIAMKRNGRPGWQQLLLAFLLTVCSALANSHDSGYASLALDLTAPDYPLLSVELDVTDLELAVGLDSDGDGVVIWQEYIGRRRAIEQYLVKVVHFRSASGSCTLIPEHRVSGVRPTVIPSVVSVFSLKCGEDTHQSLTVSNQLLTNIDSRAKTLLTITAAGFHKSMLLGTGETTITINSPQRMEAAAAFITEGIKHIVGGVDHLVFLLVLLLPAANRGAIRQRVVAIAGVITAFTLAHSITLALSVFGYLGLPSRTAELVIAGSVVMAGVINCANPQHRISWLMAYSFGLIHGFGFAGALGELVGTGSISWLHLAAFNLGVELGQLAIMLLSLPLLVWLGSKIDYSRYVVQSLSLLVVVTGCFWVIERW